MPHSLTTRQKEYLAFISEYISLNESSPRLEVIANHFKVKLPSVHKMLERLQSKGYLLFRRDTNTGFWIRLVERAGTKEILTEVAIIGKLDKFGELFDFPTNLGHFPSVLSGSRPEEIFSLVAFEPIPELNVSIGDAIIFDHGRKAKPGDICISPFGERLFLIRIASKTFDKDFLSDVMASEFPMPAKLIREDRGSLLNWIPATYTEDTEPYFLNILEEHGLSPRGLPDDFILATAIRLSRQLSW